MHEGSKHQWCFVSTVAALMRRTSRFIYIYSSTVQGGGGSFRIGNLWSGCNGCSGHLVGQTVTSPTTAGCSVVQRSCSCSFSVVEL